MSENAALRTNADPPQPGPIRPFHLPPVEEDRLAGGLEVRTMSRRDSPLVSGCLVLDAGETSSPEEQAGLAVLTGDSLTGGTTRRSGAELDEALERLGARLRVSTGWDATTVSFTCVAERLDAVLDILAEVVRRPAFPETEVARVRRQRLASIRQRRMEPGKLANDEMSRVLFTAGHPYGRPLSGREETVSALGPEDARAFARRRYRPAGGGFALVGDLDVADATERAGRHLGDWAGEVPARGELPPPTLAETRPVVLVHRPDAVQSEIRIGHPGPSRGVDEEAVLQVGNTVLGGAFTSRLNLNLRERHGFTYGVRSRFNMRRRGGAFIISTSVETRVTARALDEAMSEFRSFVAEGPTDREVERGRDYLAGIFPLRMETGEQLASRLAELLVFDLPSDYHHTYRDRIRAVEPVAVEETMRRHLDPGRAPIVVVGDVERIRDEVEALELGTVVEEERGG